MVQGNSGRLQFSWRDDRRESEAHLVGPAQLLMQGPWGKSPNTTEWLNTYVCTVCACLLKRCTERHPHAVSLPSCWCHVVRLSVHLMSPSCERNISLSPRGYFFKFGTHTYLDLRINWSEWVSRNQRSRSGWRPSWGIPRLTVNHSNV